MDILVTSGFCMRRVITLVGRFGPHPDRLLCSRCHLLRRGAWDSARRERADMYARDVAAICQVEGRETGALLEAGG